MTDRPTAAPPIARTFCSRNPERLRLLQHPGGVLTAASVPRATSRSATHVHPSSPFWIATTSSSHNTCSVSSKRSIGTPKRAMVYASRGALGRPQLPLRFRRGRAGLVGTEPTSRPSCHPAGSAALWPPAPSCAGCWPMKAWPPACVRSLSARRRPERSTALRTSSTVSSDDPGLPQQAVRAVSPFTSTARCTARYRQHGTSCLCRKPHSTRLSARPCARPLRRLDQAAARQRLKLGDRCRAA